MSTHYRCPSCGNEDAGTDIYQCDKGHVYCESCSGVNRLCRRCDEWGYDFGVIEERSIPQSAGSSDLPRKTIETINEYLRQKFDDDVRMTYEKHRELFELGVSRQLKRESKEKVAQYLYTMAFIAGWNARR